MTNKIMYTAADIVCAGYLHKCDSYLIQNKGMLNENSWDVAVKATTNTACIPEYLASDAGQKRVQYLHDDRISAVEKCQCLFRLGEELADKDIRAFTTK